MEIIESKDLREELILRVEVLERVKNLLLLPNTDLMTTKMVADYYGVPLTAINMILLRHREELELDGIVKYSYKEIQNLTNYNNLKELKISGQGANLFTKRAVLRIGRLLRDSEGAKEVRTQLLNIVEKVDDDVKVVELTEERVLLLAVVEATNETDLLMAVSRLDNFRKRHIAQLEETLGKKDEEIQQKVQEIEVLVGEKVGLNKGDTLVKIVQAMTFSLKSSIDKPYSFYYNEIYSRLSRKHGISVWKRKGQSKDKEVTPIYTYIKEEWSIVYSVVTAVAKYYSVDIFHIILE